MSENNNRNNVDSNSEFDEKLDHAKESAAKAASQAPDAAKEIGAEAAEKAKKAAIVAADKLSKSNITLFFKLCGMKYYVTSYIWAAVFVAATVAILDGGLNFHPIANGIYCFFGFLLFPVVRYAVAGKAKLFFTYQKEGDLQQALKEDDGVITSYLITKGFKFAWFAAKYIVAFLLWPAFLVISGLTINSHVKKQIKFEGILYKLAAGESLDNQEKNLWKTYDGGPLGAITNVIDRIYKGLELLPSDMQIADQYNLHDIMDEVWDK